MSDWLDTLLRLRDASTPAVLVTVAATKGSVPREAGTKMVVTASDVHGTIGGGHLEHNAVAIARDKLTAQTPSEPPLRRFPLGASLGQCCGGLVHLSFEPVGSDARWLDALAAARRDAVDAVAVTAVDGNGADGRLIVTRDALHGSVDENVDETAAALARTLLADDAPARLATIGARTLLLDPIRAHDWRIVLFGAGHVARALVRVLADAPCRITWVDEREAEFPNAVPSNATIVCTDAPQAEVDAAPAGAYFLVMTHSHPLDEALTETILRRSDYAYFGLIGSLTKRRAFEKRLARRGMPAERFATMTCPIGIAGIPGKEPAAIAIAAAAQLMQVRACVAGARTQPERAMRTSSYVAISNER